VGYAKRVDNNHAALVNALRRAGFMVCDLSKCGGGVPDLLVYHQSDPERRLVLLEVKHEKGALTIAQRAFHAVWPVTILRDIEGVIALMKEKAA
jgi:hypothetical protein